MSQVMDNIFWIVFIGFIIMSAVFNAVGAKLKQAAEAAEKTRDYQKGPKKFNPFGGESPEEFFDRVKKEEGSKKKLKLKDQGRLSQNIPENKPPQMAKYESPETDVIVESVKRTTRKKRKKATNKINMRDKSSIRKAIIINEVLNPPKAYKL